MIAPVVADSSLALKDAQRQQARSADGLVLCHISDRDSIDAGKRPVRQELTAKVSIYADVVKVHRATGEQRGGGKRGKVVGFSDQSRKRFIESLAKSRQAADTFITLTYPNNFPSDPKVWKRDLATLLKRLKRFMPLVTGHWRLEFQTRKSGSNKGKVAPHFHLLLSGRKSSIKRFRLWLSLAWYEVVGSGDGKHLWAGTEASEIKSRRHAMFYASKYAAKVDERVIDPGTGEVVNTWPDGTGRLWGVFGDLDRSAVLVFQLTSAGFVDFRRLVVKWLAANKSKYARRLARSWVANGFTAFGLGDRHSETWVNPFDSTVARMLFA